MADAAWIGMLLLLLLSLSRSLWVADVVLLCVVDLAVTGIIMHVFRLDEPPSSLVVKCTDKNARYIKYIQTYQTQTERGDFVVLCF